MTDAVGPGATRTATLTGAPSGRAAGQLTLEVLDAAGAAVRAASGAGLVEMPTGAGASTYTLTYSAPLVAGTYVERWRDTVPNPDVVVDVEITVAWSALAPPPGPSYATPDALRAELGLTPAELDDDAANRLIVNAQERVDELVGPGTIDIDTGLKIKVAAIQPWQALKLQRATVILAKAEQRDPDAFTPPRYASISGPDFSKSQPIGSGLPGATKQARRRAANLLADAGLRVVAVRAAAGVDGIATDTLRSTDPLR
jgi:hypothetical protein